MCCLLMKCSWTGASCFLRSSGDGSSAALMDCSNLVRKLNETIKVPADRIATEYRNRYLCHTLKLWEFVEIIAPLHQTHINEKICKELLNPRSSFPLEALRAYYGEEM